jgi:hypothetical protein
MTEQLDILQRRVSILERRIFLLAACCLALATYVVLFGTRSIVKATAQPETLTVRRLAVVDEKGTERVVIAAPLPDLMIQGKRYKRDGAISGILIFDPKGNERGGYVTSDTSSAGAFLSLDSERTQVFMAYANADDGATVSLNNDKLDSIAFTTYGQPLIQMAQNRKIIYKNPSTAPDLH